MNARRSLLAWILLLVTALSGCTHGAVATGESELSTNESAVGPIRVQVIQPEVTNLRRTTTQPVSVFPYHEASLNAKVSGYLNDLRVDIGDTVQAGDVLAVLSIPEMTLEIEEQEAVILRLHAEEKQAAAAVALAQANVTVSAALLAQAESEVQKSVAEVRAEQSEFRRIADLVNRQSVEARMEDEARQRLESAQAGQQAAEAAVTSAQASVTVAEARLHAAQAEVERAVAETAISHKQLERLRTMAQYGTLAAPFDGVVTARQVDLGDLVGSAQTSGAERAPLFKLAQINRVRVRVAIPEDDAPWTNVGDAVTVRLSSLRGQSFVGTVSRVSNSLDASTRTLLAEVDLENPNRQLLPGMYGEATIVLDEKPNALVLPARSIRFDAKGTAQVYTVDASGTVQAVDVAIGVDDGHQIEIVSGLSPEDRVVDGMLDRLSSGQQVQVDP